MSTQTAVKPSLTLKRRIKAAPAKVYEAFTDAQTLVRWFGPPGIVRTEAEIDARVGGRYTIIGYTADDSHHVSGVYREVVPNEKLVFTWAWRSTPERESLVTVTFKPDGTGTLLTLLHEQFFDEPARDRHNQGWTGAIDKLEQMFA